MRGEVRESGLTGVTRNHVSPCGSGGSNPPLSANLTSRNCDGGICSATRCLCVNLLAHDRPWAERRSGFCQLSLRSSRRPSQIRMRPENVYRYLFWPQGRIERLNERTRSFESSIAALRKQHLEGSGNLRVLRIKAYVVQRDRRAGVRILIDSLWVSQIEGPPRNMWSHHKRGKPDD